MITGADLQAIRKFVRPEMFLNLAPCEPGLAVASPKVVEAVSEALLKATLYCK